MTKDEPETVQASRDGRGRVTPDEALALLMEGNERYVARVTGAREPSTHTAGLVTEQAPIAGVLSCSDARVGPEMVFDRGAGELFLVRVAGNMLGDYGLASLEYCVEQLDVPLLMVLGHTRCGAVTAAVDVVERGQTLPGRLPVLTDALEPSVLRAKMEHPDDLILAAVWENVRRQVSRLETISPVISAALDAGRVRIVGGVYDVDTGKVALLD